MAAKKKKRRIQAGNSKVRKPKKPKTRPIPKPPKPKPRAQRKPNKKPGRKPRKPRKPAEKPGRKPRKPRKPARIPSKRKQQIQEKKDDAYLGLIELKERLDTERFEREEREAIQDEREDVLERFFSNFVDAEDIEFLHRNGTVAVYPTILRHLPETDAILDRLQEIGDRGSPRFEREAEAIAELYGVPIREVYTLFMSP